MAETQSTNLKLDLVDGDSLFDTDKVKSNFEKIDTAVGSLTDKKMDNNYTEISITTDTAGRVKIPYKADKLINCTVADSAYIAIPRFLSREEKACLVYLYGVDDLKKAPNVTSILQIRYID